MKHLKLSTDNIFREAKILVEDYSSKNKGPSLISEVRRGVQETLPVAQQELSAAVQYLRNRIDDQVRELLVNFIRNRKKP